MKPLSILFLSLFSLSLYAQSLTMVDEEVTTYSDQELLLLKAELSHDLAVISAELEYRKRLEQIEEEHRNISPEELLQKSFELTKDIKLDNKFNNMPPEELIEYSRSLIQN